MSTLDIYIEKGRKEGIARGIEIGMQIGIERGIEKGIGIGEEKTNHQVVKNLILKMGLSNVQIRDVAEVPVAFVAKVRQQLNK